MLAQLSAASARFDADQLHPLIGDEGMKHADRIAAAADAGEHLVGQPALGIQNLSPRFFADDAMEIADHHRIRMRAQRRAKQVVRGLDVGDPVAHRLADRVLQRAAAVGDTRPLRRPAAACGRRSAAAAACPLRPCRRRSSDRTARTRSRSRRRAVRPRFRR